jgi:hypothetical protein
LPLSPRLSWQLSPSRHATWFESKPGHPEHCLADLPKEGSHYDLPIALALMAAIGAIPLDGYTVLGELGLDGSLAAVAGCGPVAVPLLLWRHPICGFEVRPGIADELRVVWMIDGFHAGDDVHQLRIVAVNVFDQFGLCIGWTGNENCTGIGHGLHDRVKERVIFRGVSASDRVRLVMDVPGRMIRVQDDPIDVRRAEMEYPRLVVIDPNNRVKVMLAHMVLFWRPEPRLEIKPTR